MSSLTSKVLSSSILSLAIQVIQRGIGLISILILARLLTPDDYGVVAIILLIVYFCDVLSNIGSQQYIIRKQSLCDEDVNTAWTLDLILKFILWICLIVCSPLLAAFYDDPRLINALYVSSFYLLISALKSPSLTLLRRDLNYKPILKISACQKLISFMSVMLIVFAIEPSYWALIVGHIVSAITLTIGSYFIHPVRPKLTVIKIREMWSFSQWMLLRGVTGYVRAQVDIILVTKLFTSDQIGTYHIARQLSVMPSTDIIGPAIQPLLAAFSQVRHNRSEFAYQFSLSFFVVCILILPISIFLYYFPQPVINFFLGDQWKNAYPILSALSIFLFAIAISQLTDQSCVALGKVRALFIYDLVSLMFITSTLIILHETNLELFAIQRGVLSVISATVLIIYLGRMSKLSPIRLLLMILPIAMSSFGAAFVVNYFGTEWSSLALIDLSISLLMYGGIYLVLVLLCYWLFYRNTREGQHLFRLFSQVFERLRWKLL